MKITDDTKLVAIGTLLVLVAFGGGSIFMTYRAAKKNTPPPTPIPHPSIFDIISSTPIPTITPSITPSPTIHTKIIPRIPTAHVTY